MKEIMLIGTQLTGTQQTIAKWILFVLVGIWVALKIIIRLKGKDE